MLIDDTVPWGVLERWAAPALVLAALAASGSEAFHHLELAGVLTTPVWVSALLTNLTYGAAMVGLLGIYPRVVDDAPRLMRAGLVTVGVVLVSVVAANAGRVLFGLDGPMIAMLVVSVAFYASTTIAFLLFGVACTRSSSLSRTLGVLLLVVALARVLVFVGGILGLTWPLEVGAVLFILPLLTVGYLLHRTTGPTDVEEQPTPTAD